MKVLVNNYPVEFELEKEHTISEVAESIEAWAKERDLIFLEAVINGQEYKKEALPALPVGEVDTLNCIIQSKADLIMSSLMEGIGYCDRVTHYIDNAVESEKFNLDELQFLYTGIQWLEEMLLSIFQILDYDPQEIKYLDTSVQEYLAHIKRVEKDLSAVTDEKKILAYLKEKKSFFGSFKGMIKMILLSDKLKKILINSIDSPDALLEGLKKVQKTLPEQAQNLTDIAAAYQAGKDKEGSEKLQGFIDFVYQYLRTSYQSVPMFNVELSSVEIDGISLEEKNSEINQFLEEIVDVMENNDIISLADILEYEMKPLLENLADYIDLLLQKIK